MYLIVTVFVLANAIMANSECQVKIPTKDVGFSLPQFVGNWYWILRVPNDMEKDMGCIKDHYNEVKDNTDTMFTRATHLPEETIQTYNGSVPKWGSEWFYNAYEMGDTIWIAQYYVYAVKYNEYAAITACLKGADEPYMWVGFRSKNPSPAVIAEAKKALDDNGGDSSKLVMYPNCGPL